MIVSLKMLIMIRKGGNYSWLVLSIIWKKVTVWLLSSEPPDRSCKALICVRLSLNIREMLKESCGTLKFSLSMTPGVRSENMK